MKVTSKNHLLWILLLVLAVPVMTAIVMLLSGHSFTLKSAGIYLLAYLVVMGWVAVGMTLGRRIYYSYPRALLTGLSIGLVCGLAVWALIEGGIWRTGPDESAGMLAVLASLPAIFLQIVFLQSENRLLHYPPSIAAGIAAFVTGVLFDVYFPGFSLPVLVLSSSALSGTVMAAGVCMTNQDFKKFE